MYVKVGNQSWNFVFQIENGIDLIESNVFYLNGIRFYVRPKKGRFPTKMSPKWLEFLV